MIKHNGKLFIATGKSRKEQFWKNREWQWSDFVAKLSETHYTAETHAEYMAAPKSRQDEIKDIGGFVGGYLAGGKRSRNSVLHRQLITLDIDHANEDFWDDFTMIYACSTVVYSTHKHTSKNPRLRLIVPLDREVTPEEYEAISRRVAGSIDIELFDPTTFQPSRLMYWPSSSKNGEYYFKHQDGPWLSTDRILSSYHDWQDASEWPVSSKHQDVINRGIARQGDPLEKPGIVGAFCRAFDIHEAISRYLPEIYSECDTEGRYTFLAGTTSGGLVTYEDKFAYSHHGSDPISGKLCNAFDLVRIHLFGIRDEDSTAMGNRLPSYQAMCEFASKDKEVRKIIGEEKIKEAFSDFGGEVPEDFDSDWMAELEADKRANYLSTVFNVKLILENDPRLKGRIALNEFNGRTYVRKPFPWDRVRFSKPREWNDDDFAILQNYLSLGPYNLNIAKEKVKNVIVEVRKDNTFHPVKDYLSSLKWDEEERIDSLLIDCLGAADDDYTRAVTRKTLVAAVSRIYDPGCKFDYVLTLIGKEGIGKSTLYKKLGKEWFSDTFNFNMVAKGDIKAYEQLQGYWLIEVPEMTGLKKADENAVKAFISSSSDSYRAAYAHDSLERKRQGIFLGSSNNDDFLNAGTGNRRFWPVRTDIEKATKDVKRLSSEEIDQIWAEAVFYYKAGETLYLNETLEAEARKRQKEHTEEHPWLQAVEEYLEKLLPENWKDMGEWERRGFIANNDPLEKGTIRRDKVSIKEIWTECLESKHSLLTTSAKRDITRIMNNMGGWEKHDKAIKLHNGDVQKGWIRAEIVTRKSGNF